MNFRSGGVGGPQLVALLRPRLLLKRLAVGWRRLGRLRGGAGDDGGWAEVAGSQFAKGRMKGGSRHRSRHAEVSGGTEAAGQAVDLDLDQGMQRLLVGQQQLGRGSRGWPGKKAWWVKGSEGRQREGRRT